MKRRTLQKRTSTVLKTRGRKAAPVAERKGLRRAKNEKTVFTRIKHMLDETTAKLKTILPGETRTNRRDVPK
jgi:hypothetical protein